MDQIYNSTAMDAVVVDPDMYYYGGNLFQSFSDVYDVVHKPLASLICIVGIGSNFINLLVLTRPKMINVTNVLLTGLSAAQLFLLTNYLSLLLFNHLVEKCSFPSNQRNNSIFAGMLTNYNWVLYKWINVNLSLAFHSTAFGHTLFLALFRFIAIAKPHYGRVHLNLSNARCCVIALHIVIPLTCCPTFFTTSINKITSEEMCGLEEYYDLRYAASQEFFQATLWIYGVLFKLVPSIMISVISFYLIKSLKNIHTKTAQLTHRKENSKRKMFRLKLTKMLIVVALLCVSVEFPHGVVNMLTGVFGPQFGLEVYDNLGDFFEMLTLFYSSVNFLLYCLMNTGYQRTVKYLMYKFMLKSFCRRKFMVVDNETGTCQENTEFNGSQRKYSDEPI